MNDLIETLNYENNIIRRKLYNNEYFYPVCDVLRIIYEVDCGCAIWKKLKNKIELQGFPTIYSEIENIKFDDGEHECVTREILFLIINYIDSPKVASFKAWIVSLADEQLEEILDPSLAVMRARNRYASRGYTSEWIDLRLKTAGVRNKELSEWHKRGANSDEEVALLTDNISKETFGKTVNEYKEFKNLDESSSLRDNMSPLELAVTNFADQVAIEMHKKRDSQGMDELSRDTIQAGQTARFAREQAEQALESPVMTSKNAFDFINSRKELKDENN